MHPKIFSLQLKCVNDTWRKSLAVFFFALVAAGQSSAQTAICSNSVSLDFGFVSLIADHFDSDLDVMLNPEELPGNEDWRSNTLQVYVAEGEYGSVLQCVEHLGVDPVRVDQEIRGLREKIGEKNEPIFPAVQGGITISIGALFVLAEKRVFIRVSKGESLVSAADAVLTALGLDGQSCWFSQECLKAAEEYWAK